MTRRRLAVVVVNYQTPETTTDCLATLEHEIDPAQDVVLVVDNASPDASAATLREEVAQRGWQPWVRLLTSDVNRGFSGGNNLGIEAVSADFYLLLNSDALVQPGAVAQLLEAAERSPRAGLWGPRLQQPDAAPQTSCFRYHSPLSELISAAATGPVTRLLGRWDVPLSPAEGAARPDWISFACVLIRREVFADVGPLDDGYFMYYEDVDFCRRARRAGWQLQSSPEARVVHFGNGSSSVESADAPRTRRPRYFYESRSRYFAKFYGRAGLLLANLLWTAGRAVALARELVGNKTPHTRVKQSRDIWSGFRRPIRPLPPTGRTDAPQQEVENPSRAAAS